MVACVSVDNTITVITPAAEGSTSKRWFSRVSSWQLSSFVLTVAGFVFCATATGVEWRVWYIENDPILGSGILSIGIWEVCFTQRKKGSQNHDFPRCRPFNEDHTTLPKAILTAQDMMIFVNLLDVFIIEFMFFALWDVLKGKKAQDLLVPYFCVAATLNFFSAALLLGPSCQNTRSILRAEEISFPPEFRLPKSPNDQDIGVGIYLAYCAVILKFLSGLLVVLENSLWKFKESKPPKKLGPHSRRPRKSVSQTGCKQCASSIDLNDFVVIGDWCSDVQFSGRLKSSPEDSQAVEHQIIDIPLDIPISAQIQVTAEIHTPPEIPKSLEIPIPEEIPKPPEIPISVEIPIPEEIPTPPEIPTPLEIPIPPKSTT